MNCDYLLQLGKHKFEIEINGRSEDSSLFMDLFLRYNATVTQSAWYFFDKKLYYRGRLNNLIVADYEDYTLSEPYMWCNFDIGGWVPRSRTTAYSWFKLGKDQYGPHKGTYDNEQIHANNDEVIGFCGVRGYPQHRKLLAKNLMLLVNFHHWQEEENWIKNYMLYVPITVHELSNSTRKVSLTAEANNLYSTKMTIDSKLSIETSDDLPDGPVTFVKKPVAYRDGIYEIAANAVDLWQTTSSDLRFL